MKLPQLGRSLTLPELIKILIEWGRLIEAADGKNLKRSLDVELPKGARLIVTGDDDLRYVIEVVAGSITATPV